jgi:hypothetical protein
MDLWSWCWRLRLDDEQRQRNPTTTMARRMNAMTIEPVAAAADGEVEFVDYRGAERICCTKKSLLYTWERAGFLQGFVVRRRGRARGKKLFRLADIRALVLGNPVKRDKNGLMIPS